ncbi:MAG TPA: hypothetical protein VL175_05070 [Pirellulales bacterium]|jgi:hypothetical protein|nr:hypothetical protein [Pirellulales bacterium]
MWRQLFVATALFVVGWLNAGTLRGQDGPLLPGYAGPPPDMARERVVAPRQFFKKKPSDEANSAAGLAPQIVDDRGNVTPQPSESQSRSKLLTRSPKTSGNAEAPRRSLRAPFGGALSKAAAAQSDRARQNRSAQQNGMAPRAPAYGQSPAGQSAISTPEAGSGETGRRLLQQPLGVSSSMRRMTQRGQAEARDHASGQATQGDLAPRWTGALSAPPTDSAR